MQTILRGPAYCVFVYGKEGDCSFCIGIFPYLLVRVLKVRVLQCFTEVRKVYLEVYFTWHQSMRAM